LPSPVPESQIKGMATATLDTLTIVKRLREAGVPEGQAETWATIWRDQREPDLSQLATKADLDQLGQRLEQRISARITESQNALIKAGAPPGRAGGAHRSSGQAPVTRLRSAAYAGGAVAPVTPSTRLTCPDILLPAPAPDR